MAGFPLGSSGARTGGHDHPISGGAGAADQSLFLYTRGGGGGSGGGESSSNIGFQLWQPTPHQPGLQMQTPPFFTSGVAPGVVLGFSSSHDAAGSAGGSGGRAGTSCQDCGNNAKKDCAHLRCRTCCRSRGFSCPTHVKSTWVPAAKRRERQQQLAALFRGGGAAASEPAKRDAAAMFRSFGRIPAAAAAATHASSVVAVAGEGTAGQFPPEVSSEAVFRCVRIGPVDEAKDDEFAYQTTVTIGGHVFRGILRDHGPDSGWASTSSERYGQLPPGPEGSSPAGSSSAAAGGHAVTSATAIMMDPYPTPIVAFAAGTQFFPHNTRP